MTITEAITAAQAAKKVLVGADGLVVTEAQSVADEQAKLDAAVAEKKAADEAEAAAKDAYRKSLGDLIDAANSEISGL